MKQDMNIKAISALREELKDTKSRFTRLVNSISAVEEFAGRMEYGLTDLQEKLKIIVTNYRSGLALGSESSTSSREIRSVKEKSPAPDDNTGSQPSSPNNFYKEIVGFYNLFLGMAKRCSNLTKRINGIDDAARNIDLALKGIQERLKDLIYKNFLEFNKNEKVVVPINRNNVPSDYIKLLLWSAESGVDSLDVKQFANGRAEFEIENRQLTLSPRLSTLLIALSRDTGPSENGLVGWKSIPELAEMIHGPKHGSFPEKKDDRKKLHRAILQSLYLLRNAFSAAGVNPYLIQSNAELGYRFALKRRPGPHTGFSPDTV